MATVVRHIWDRDAQELSIFFVLIVVTLALYVFRDYIRIYWIVFQLKGPKAVPFFGNVDWIYRKELLEVISHRAYTDYGPIIRFWITFVPYVILLEPEDVQAVLAGSKHTRKIFFYRLLNNFLGKGLITSDVDTWRTHRRVLQPAFHLQVLQKFLGSFVECSDRLTNRILKHDGRQIDVTRFVNDTVYEILNETVLGVDLAGKIKENGDVDLDDLPFRKGQMVAPYRLVHPWLLIDWIYKLTSIGRQEKQQSQDLSAACRRILEEKREARRAAGRSERGAAASLLDYMLETSERNPDWLSDEDIIDECSTFMLAGQDSVGTATAMTLFLLANHPHWQRRCVEELDGIFGASARPPSMQDLRAMRQLECCVKEALRLYPSVPIFARTLGEDVKVGKHVLPAGCGVMILPYGTHRLPHHFPDPHSFRPERFSPENSEERHPYAYLPFSAGPRNCIGNKFAILEMKAIVSAILRRCQLSSVEGNTEVRPKFRMTVRAAGGLWLKITQRLDAR